MRQNADLGTENDIIAYGNMEAMGRIDAAVAQFAPFANG